MTTRIISQSYLHTILDYNQHTGVFTWRINKGQRGKAGSETSVLGNHGYKVIKIDSIRHQAHRLAWLYMTGSWPVSQIDHINRIKTDNRFENLREVTLAENAQNHPVRIDNTSGHVGVCWHKTTNKWIAKISINKKAIHLGVYANIADAIKAYNNAVLIHHPFRGLEHNATANI